MCHQAYVHSRTRLPKLLHAEPCRGYGFKGRLEKEALLGIHTLGFSSLNVEEGCVKSIKVFAKKIAIACISTAMDRPIRVVESINIEPLLWDCALEIARSLEDFPQLGGTVKTAGKTVGAPNNLVFEISLSSGGDGTA